MLVDWEFRLGEEVGRLCRYVRTFDEKPVLKQTQRRYKVKKRNRKNTWHNQYNSNSNKNDQDENDDNNNNNSNKLQHCYHNINNNCKLNYRLQTQLPNTGWYPCYDKERTEQEF